MGGSSLFTENSFTGTNDNNIMYMRTLVGDTDLPSVPQFNLGISTGGSALELFSSSCNKCVVESKYNADDSFTVGESTVPSYQTKISSIFNGHFDHGGDFDSGVLFDGVFKTEDFRIRIDGFNRETILQDFDFSVLNF